MQFALRSQRFVLTHLLQILVHGVTASDDPRAKGQYLTIIVHYPSSILAVCPGRLKIASSLNDFQEAVPLHWKASDMYESMIFFPVQYEGTKVTLSLVWDVELYQGVVPPQCKARCAAFSLALMESMGPRLQFVLPKGGKNSSLHSWPAFCGMRSESHRTQIWSVSLNRSFNFTVTKSATLVENSLVRELKFAPPVLIRLDAQWLWPSSPGNGDEFLSEAASEFTTDPPMFIDIDLSLNGDNTWRHPLLTPGPMKDCPSHSLALKFMPALRGIWEGWSQPYRSLNRTVGFGNLNSFLDFLIDTLLPYSMETHMPILYDKSKAVAKLNVGLWGVSDAGIAVWYAFLTRPTIFNMGIMQSPFLPWNCGEVFDQALSNTTPWLENNGRKIKKRLRLYIDYGTGEQVDAFQSPTRLFFHLLTKQGLAADNEVFLAPSVGDFHSDLAAFKSRAPKALRALFVSATLPASPRHGTIDLYTNLGDPPMKPWNDIWLPSTSAPEYVHLNLHGTTYRLWAQLVGPPKASISILLLNGGPGKPHTELDGLSEELIEFKLVYWDSLGSHGSDCFHASEQCTWHPESWGSLEDFVAQAQAVLTHFKLEPAKTILLAHSFGVVLALELASRSLSGSQYLGLVLTDWVASQTLVRTWMHTHACLLTEPQGDYPKPGCLYFDTAKAPPPNVAYTFNSTNPGPLSRFVWGPNGNGQGGWMQSWDRMSILSKLSSPALWIAGGFDLVNPIDVRACADLMRRGSFVKIPAAGHNSFADVPRKWIHELKRWLRTELRVPAEQSLSAWPTLSQSHWQASSGITAVFFLVVGAALGWVLRCQDREKISILHANLLGNDRSGEVV